MAVGVYYILLLDVEILAGILEDNLCFMVPVVRSQTSVLLMIRGDRPVSTVIIFCTYWVSDMRSQNCRWQSQSPIKLTIIYSPR